MKENNLTSKQLTTLYIFILFIFGMLATSCGMYKMTERQIIMEYKLDKLYLEYSYERDSLLLEYYKKQ